MMRAARTRKNARVIATLISGALILFHGCVGRIGICVKHMEHTKFHLSFVIILVTFFALSESSPFNNICHC